MDVTRDSSCQSIAFKGIAFIIAMWSREFNKYSYLHLSKGSLVSRACCFSDFTRQQTKSPSSDIRGFMMEITKTEKIIEHVSRENF